MIKVLHIAEAANPQWVSVPLVGWSCWKALSEVTESHLVTQVRNKESIEQLGYIKNKDFTAIDNEFIAKPLYKLGSLLRGGDGVGWTTLQAMNYIPYLFFEKIVWKKFKRQIVNGDFDLIHRITPLSPSMPSYIAKKAKKYGVPFIIGPINGGLPWPEQFSDEKKKEKEWLSHFRNIYKYLPGYHSTRKNASAIITASQTAMSELEHKYRKKAVYIPENGIDPNKFYRIRSKKAEIPIRAIFIGRLVPCKGVSFLLKGLNEFLLNGEMELDIIGDGPEKNNLMELATELNIQSKVHFHGWVEHSQVQDYICNADLLTFPSIREFGGGVVLEAMALGLMPLVIDYGGPGELFSSKEGVKIPISSESEIIKSIHDVVLNLINEPYKIDDLGNKSYKRVQDYYLWSAKANQIKEVYSWVLDNSSKKPELIRY